MRLLKLLSLSPPFGRKSVAWTLYVTSYGIIEGASQQTVTLQGASQEAYILEGDANEIKVIEGA